MCVCGTGDCVRATEIPTNTAQSGHNRERLQESSYCIIGFRESPLCCPGGVVHINAIDNCAHICHGIRLYEADTATEVHTALSRFAVFLPVCNE